MRLLCGLCLSFALQVDGAGPGAAKTELSEVNESRPKLEENAHMSHVTQEFVPPATFWEMLQVPAFGRCLPHVALCRRKSHAHLQRIRSRSGSR